MSCHVINVKTAVLFDVLNAFSVILHTHICKSDHFFDFQQLNFIRNSHGINNNNNNKHTAAVTHTLYLLLIYYIFTFQTPLVALSSEPVLFYIHFLVK